MTIWLDKNMQGYAPASGLGWTIWKKWSGYHRRSLVQTKMVYVVNFTDAVYVLHCFQKKTQQTAKRDIELAQKRLKDLLKEITP